MRIVTAFVLSLFLAAPAAAEILIGIAGPLSGQNAVFGNELRLGATAAVTAINAQGGINGEPLGLVEGDDACDPRRAVDVAKTFVGRDVRMVVGHFCSSASLAAAPEYLSAGILMITPTASSPALTGQNFWNVLRLTGREDAQADFAASRIKSLGQAGEVILLTDQQAETAALARAFKNALPNAKQINVKAGTAKLPDDASVLTATAIYLALQSTDAGELADPLRRLNPDVALYGPDFLQSENYATKAGEAANGTRVSFLRDWATSADPKRVALLTTTEGATLAAFAAVEVFAAAAKARSVNDSRGMASWINGGNEIPTILGPLRFTPSGDLQTQPYVWYQWRDGALVPDLQTP